MPPPGDDRALSGSLIRQGGFPQSLEVSIGGQAERTSAPPLHATRPLQTVRGAQSQPSPPRALAPLRRTRGAGRAARASQKRGTWAWSQRRRRCQPGKAEARRVPQRTQVTGEWCSRGNSGRTASARGPPPLPSPPPRPLRARVQPQGLSCLRPGAGCFSKTWVPLLQVTLISCPRTPSPAPGAFC